LGVGYTFNAGTDTPFDSDLSAEAPDPVSAANLPSCNCNAVKLPLFASHCLQSIEISEAAQTEAIGHFFSSRMWNRTPTEADYNGSCTFNYYKYVSDPAFKTTDDGIPPVPFNCAMAYAHRDTTCSAVNINGATKGNEADWLTFYWSISTDTTAPGPVTPNTLLRWYKEAHAKLPPNSGPIMTYARLRVEAVEDNAAFGAWLDAKAHMFAVD
jgi:hypothetical protein